MSDVRVYFIISTGTLPSPTEVKWGQLIQQDKTKPLSAAILAAARASQNYISASKRSFDLKYTLCSFEVEDRQVAGITAVLNAQAVIRGVTGTLKQKFTGVLTGELRESALDLGYTVNQSNQLAVTLINNGGFDRMTAIAAVAWPDGYLALNAALWYAPA